VERKHGARAVVPPNIQTLSEFFQRLYLKLVGPALIDENSRLILFEGIVKELITATGEFGGKPTFSRRPLRCRCLDGRGTVTGQASSPNGWLRPWLHPSPLGNARFPCSSRLMSGYERILADKGWSIQRACLRADRYASTRHGWQATGPWSSMGYTMQRTPGAVLRTLAAHAECTLLVDAASLDAVRSAGEIPSPAAR